MMPPTDAGQAPGPPEHNQPTLLDPGPVRPALSSPSIPAPLTRLGDYELIREVGRGGMGVVFEARHVRLNRTVALKMILGGAMAAREDLHRFETEAAAAAQLQHPGIVGLYEVGAFGEQPYFSMEFISGSSLAQRVQQGPMASRRAAGYIEAVARAVHYAHTRGIIHRDLKPANVLLDEHDRPKVTDFGLAKLLATDSGQTRTGAVLGTPSYMSPEQAAAEKQIGPAADVWSLGAILYELLTGRPPFRGETALATLQQVADIDPVAPRLLDPAIDHDLETICLKCLEKDPARRYRSAEEVANDLRRVLDGESIQARRVGMMGRTVKFCRRKPALASLILVASAAVVSLLLFFIASAREERFLRGEAEKAQHLALVREEAMRHLLYHAEMRRAQQALEQADPARVRRLLAHWEPRPGQKDFRDWEWFFLRDHTQGRYVIEAHPYQVSAVAWRPDGTQLATAGGEPGKPGTIKLWDGHTGRLLATLLGHARSITSIAFHPTKNWLASAGYDASIIVWDLDQARPLARLKGHAGEVRDVVFSPQGELLASAGRDATVRLWDIGAAPADLNTSTVLKGHAGEVTSVAFSPDGLKLASASIDRTVKLWNVDAGHLISTLKGHESPVESVAFNADGTLLASGGGAGQGRGEVRVWDPSTAGATAVHFGISDRVRGVAFNRLGRLAAGTSDGLIRVWDSARTSEPLVFRAERHITALAFHPEGRTLAVAGQSGRVAVVAASGGLESLSFPAHGAVQTVALDPTRDALALAGRGPLGTALLEIRDLDGSDKPRQLAGHLAPVVALAYAPDGSFLASGDEEGTLLLHDLKSPDTPARTLARHDGAIRGLAFSPDSATLVSAGDDETIRLWEVTAGTLRRSLKAGHSVRAIALDHAGRYLAVGGVAKTISIWDLAEGTERQLPGHSGTVNALAFSPDGQVLASGSSDRSIRLWQLTKELDFTSLDSGSSSVHALAFHPGGGRLASLGQDRTIRLWDVVTRQEILELENASGSVASVAFSADGRYIAAPGPFGVRVWDAGPAASKR